jgi:sec-independent protein translocase protein TatA
MFSSIGPLEIVLVIVVLLIIFGPKRLPGLGRSLGGGMREFKDSITGNDKDDDERTDPPALAKAPTDAPVAAPAAEERTPVDAAPEQRS